MTNFRPATAASTALLVCASLAAAQRPTPPTRDPHSPGYVTATELPDGAVPSPNANGNFIIGPTHERAPEMAVKDDVPHGAVHLFTMSSADSRIYPGVARDSGTFGTPDPNDPAKLVVTTSRPHPYTRRVAVYVPQQYVAGSAAPFIVGQDGPDSLLFVALDNLIAQKRVPPMIAISIGNGSGDAQGSQRGLEYDTMSGRYAEFVETEVLPLVEKQYGVRLSRDPDARATMGCSSGASAAFSMAWYHPEWYHRVLSYSGTFVNQQWPPSADTPHGAWEYHERLIPNTPRKPLRIWMHVGDRDLYNPNAMRDEMHDWVVANERMAAALAAKGYPYQFVFARSSGHCDRGVKQQTLPEALEWLWRRYRIGVGPSPTFTVGDRLRISAPALGVGPRLARVVASSSDTLVVRPVDARDFTVAVPLSEVSRIEVSSGHRPRKKRFALLGLAAGSAVGALVGAATYTDPCMNDPAVCAGFFYETRQGDVVGGAFGGGILGAIGGAVLGQLWQRETWTALPLRRTGRVRVAPLGRGLASRDGPTRVGLRVSLR